MKLNITSIYLFFTGFLMGATIFYFLSAQHLLGTKVITISQPEKVETVEKKINGNKKYAVNIQLGAPGEKTQASRYSRALRENIFRVYNEYTDKVKKAFDSAEGEEQPFSPLDMPHAIEYDWVILSGESTHIKNSFTNFLNTMDHSQKIFLCHKANAIATDIGLIKCHLDFPVIISRALYRSFLSTGEFSFSVTKKYVTILKDYEAVFQFRVKNLLQVKQADNHVVLSNQIIKNVFRASGTAKLKTHFARGLSSILSYFNRQNSDLTNGAPADGDNFCTPLDSTNKLISCLSRNNGLRHTNIFSFSGVNNRVYSYNVLDAFHFDYRKELSSVSYDPTALINIIVPTFGREDRRDYFLRMMSSISEFDKNFMVYLVVTTKTISEFRTTKDKILRNFPQLTENIKIMYGNKKFNKGKSINMAVESIEDDDSLIAIIDIDMDVSVEYLKNCRKMSRPRETAYFPIIYSQYKFSQPIDDHQDVSEQRFVKYAGMFDNGMWRSNGMGMTCLSRFFFTQVEKVHEYNTWGNEDYEFYMSIINTKKYDVYRSFDFNLIHNYHDPVCDIKPFQYTTCIGSYSRLIGSNSKIVEQLKTKNSKYEIYS